MPVQDPQNDTDQSETPIPSILIDNHNSNPSAETTGALQCAIVAACYRNKTTQGKHSGGKNGSEAFDINPSTIDQDDINTKSQADYFSELIKTINSQIHDKTHPFEWQGSTIFQIKKDSAATISPLLTREQMNDNISEIIVTCISDTLQASTMRDKTTLHPNSIIFDHQGNTIIASQYLPHTVGTLNDFVAECIKALHTPNLAKTLLEINSNINLEDIKTRYNHFRLEEFQDISLVDKIPPSQKNSSPSATTSSVALSDLDDLATVFALTKDPQKTRLSPNQPIAQRLIDEISFSHLIADHDVNPGNFIVRQEDDQLAVSRIDFGMANYHFTRGNIYGFSRRPFINMITDIPKESFHDFICRKNIGFGVAPFLVPSKTFKHLQAITSLFKNSNHEEENKTTLALDAVDAIEKNQELHHFLASHSTQQEITNRFMSKIDQLPHSAKVDIVRDLKTMELQSQRSRYLDFSTRGKSLESFMKILFMFTLTPALALIRIVLTPVIFMMNLVLLALKKPLIRNPAPLTCLGLIQKISLNRSVAKAQKDDASANIQIRQHLKEIFTNNIGDIPAHLDTSTPPSTATSNPEKAQTLSPPQWLKPSPPKYRTRNQQRHGLNKPRH